MRNLTLALLAGAGLVLAAAPAMAQSVGELTVTGRLGEASRLSAPVSYADLDLTTPAGQDLLKVRIKDTARDLCTQLGESNTSSTPLVPSCEEDAVRESREQMRMAVAMAVPKTYAAAPDTSYVSDASATVADEPAPPVVDTAAVEPAPATYSTQTVTNGPVADTPANRARYGQPMSNAGRHTTPAGN